MKRIILPTDFSENAHQAIRYAVQLFRDRACTFYLLNTYTPAVYQTEYLLQSPGQIGLGDIYKENSLELLRKQRDRIQGEFRFPGHEFVIHSAFSLLVDEIQALVQHEGADLVIMGTQGATGAKEIFLGTHTVHVIKKATCPVLAIPSGQDYTAPSEILFPTDYEITYPKRPMDALLEIAHMHGSRIDVIHISETSELGPERLKKQELLDTLLTGTDHHFHILPDPGILSGINGFSGPEPVRMLVMVQNKHTLFERLFSDPVIEKVGFHTTVPFMVLPHT